MCRTAVPGLGLWAVLAIGVTVYWPGLNGPFILDDLPNLTILERLDRPEIGWSDAAGFGQSSLLGRPVSMLAFAGDYLAGGLDARTFKRTNLMLHLLCGALVFWLAGVLLGTSAARRHAWWAALWVAALWVLSPMLTSTVLYVVQRMAQMATLFVLAGALSYAYGRLLLNSRPRIGHPLILSAFLAWTPLAILSKENGVLLPLLLLVTEISFFGFVAARHNRRALTGYFAVFLGFPAAAALVWLATAPADLLGGYTLRPFTLPERLLTESRILFMYLSDLMIPNGSRMGIYHDDITLSKDIWSPPTTAPAVAGIVVMVCAPILIKNRNLRILLFGLPFFLAGHLLESAIIPLELYFEHRNYLPSIGIYISLGAGILLLARRFTRPKVIFGLAAMLPVLFAAGTHQRAHVWSSTDSMLLTAKYAHPDSTRLNIELASYHSKTGRPDRALDHLKRAVRTNPLAANGAALQRMTIYCVAGTAVAGPDYTGILVWLAGNTPDYTGLVYASQALELFVKRVTQTRCPNLDIPRVSSMVVDWATGIPASHHGAAHGNILYNAASLAYDARDTTGALQLLSIAARLYPERIETHLLRLTYLLNDGKIDSAREALRRAMNQKDFNRDEMRPFLEGFATLIRSL